MKHESRRGEYCCISRNSAKGHWTLSERWRNTALANFDVTTPQYPTPDTIKAAQTLSSSEGKMELQRWHDSAGR